MKNKNKYLIGIISLFLIAFIGIYYINYIKENYVTIHIQNIANENRYIEVMHGSLSDSYLFPKTKNAERNIREFAIWNNEIATSLLNNSIYPTEIKATASPEGTKTRMSYDGFFTDKTGERYDFHRENVFDFRTIVS